MRAQSGAIASVPSFLFTRSRPCATRAIGAALITLLITTVVQSESISVSRKSFAAIAYSPVTGEFAYSCNQSSRRAAEAAALRKCNSEGARIACWVNWGFCALAVADNKAWGTGWRYGPTASNDGAMKAAIQECEKHSSGAHIAICLSSDGQYIYEPRAKSAVVPAASGPARVFLQNKELAERLQQAALLAGLSPNDSDLTNLTPAQRLRLGIAYGLDYPSDLSTWTKVLRARGLDPNDDSFARDIELLDSVTDEIRARRKNYIKQAIASHVLDALLGENNLSKGLGVVSKNSHPISALGSEDVSKALRESREFIDLVERACATAGSAGEAPAESTVLSPAVAKALANLLLSESGP